MCNVHIQNVIRSTWKRRRQSVELPCLRFELIELGPNIIEQELEVVPVLRGTQVIDIPGILPVNVDAFLADGRRRRTDQGYNEQRWTIKNYNIGSFLPSKSYSTMRSKQF